MPNIRRPFTLERAGTRGRLVIGRPPGPRGFAVGVGRRVGITRAVDRLLRFWIRGNPYVSRP